MSTSFISRLFGRRKSNRLHQPNFDAANYVVFAVLARLLEYDKVITTAQIRFCFRESELHQLVDEHNDRLTVCLLYKGCQNIVGLIHQLCGLKFDPASSSKRVRQDFDLKFPTDVSDKVWFEGRFTVTTWPENTGRVYSFVLRKS